MVFLILLDVAILIMAVRQFRQAPPGRWLFAAAALLAGLPAVLLGGGSLIALAVRRTTWNSWAAGSGQRESVTLTALGLCALSTGMAAFSLLAGTVVAGYHRRRAARPPLAG